MSNKIPEHKKNRKSILLGPDRPDLLKEETLADIFKRSAEEHPSGTALIFKDRSVTYNELDIWSDAIAEFLAGKEIGKGQCVGIYLPRGIELHATILGIIKSGAAYVPVDYEMPRERVSAVLAEAEARGCFTDKSLNVNCSLFPPILQGSSAGNKNSFTGPDPDTGAYILYTSGTTGKPKGIPIKHRQICNLIRAEQCLFDIKPEDKVYQGFSVSFDMWCEETWISYLAGASLWIADSITAKSVDGLSEILEKEKITVLHAVPSLLAAMEKKVHSIRLVNAGGEACTPQVLKKWASNNKMFFNSYGPTETTVSASIALLKSRDAVTLGTPLPNYGLAVVDELLNPVPVGTIGELVISGIGVSEGYIKRPELTKEKFLKKPSSLSELYGDRIFKTGDAVLINREGKLVFMGRTDDQIKFHGYRIEPEEIESELNKIQGIKSSAVTVKTLNRVHDELVGYLLTEGSYVLNEPQIRSRLLKILPSYMIPAYFVVLEEMPRLPSGKINKKALPEPEFKKPDSDSLNNGPIDSDLSVAEKVEIILKRKFPGINYSPDLDFFDDLGGHSLLAALFVSDIRDLAGIRKASLKDVYLNRPLSKLIKHWEEESKTTGDVKEPFYPVNKFRYYLCGFFQTISLFFIYGLFALQFFLPFLSYTYIFSRTGNRGIGITAAFLIYCTIIPLFYLLSAGIKWLVIGRMREGDYPLWGTYYFRWWLVKRIQRLVVIEFLNDTPLYPVYLRLLGVKIGENAQLSSLSIGAEDLVQIGDDVSISSNAVLDNAYIENGLLKLRSIEICDHGYIGTNSIMGGNTRMGEWGELQDLSFLQAGNAINSKEIWKGSPAKFYCLHKEEEIIEPLHVSMTKKVIYSVLFGMVAFLLPVLFLIPLLPTIIILNEQKYSGPVGLYYLILIPVTAFSYIIIFIIQTIILTRVLHYRIKPKTYPVYSPVYFRKWISNQCMGISLNILHSIYATMYISGIFRAFGAKIGKNSEISTATGITHKMLEIGKEGFIADAATIGEMDVRGLRFTLKKTKIDDKSFVGNGAVIPQGYYLHDNMLIGVLSTPPVPDQTESSAFRNWFGSPPVAMPRRQESKHFLNYLTTNPSWKRKLARGLVEFIRILLPQAILIFFSVLYISLCHKLISTEPLWKIILLFPLYYIGVIGIPCLLITVILKWVFIGKYTPDQKPMWTLKVWRSEAITATYESVAVPFLLEYMEGTFWSPLALRLFGVKFGKRVCLNTMDFTEFDLVSIGDDTALNRGCGPQTHLFEDRIMKMGHVYIGSRCSIGNGSIILYDSKTGSDVNIEALSLVMKGEYLSDNTQWVGSPVKPSEKILQYPV